jgi:hypothetical protein
MFEPSFVARMLDEHEASRRNWSREIFGLLVFQLWYERWMSAPFDLQIPRPAVSWAKGAAC